MHGIFLFEDPIPLYRCERAKLYIGMSARVNMNENHAQIEFTPQAYVRESVLDYVKLRREAGASANAVIRNLTTYRNRVIVAPGGNYGSISDVITRKVGVQKVSDLDAQNLVDLCDAYWPLNSTLNEIYGWIRTLIYKYRDTIKKSL